MNQEIEIEQPADAEHIHHEAEKAIRKLTSSNGEYCSTSTR